MLLKNEVRYTITKKGLAAIDEAGSPLTSYFRSLDEIASGVVTTFPRSYLSRALSLGHLVRDPRTMQEVLLDIRRRNFHLANLLDVYWKVGRQEPVTEAELDMALASVAKIVKYHDDLFDRRSTSFWRELRKAEVRPKKVLLLDKAVSLMHQDGLAMVYTEIWDSPSLNQDVLILLEGLSTE